MVSMSSKMQNETSQMLNLKGNIKCCILRTPAKISSSIYVGLTILGMNLRHMVSD